jgi:acyl-CoA synthetase (AMP-forming)/AMP-acid ligase II
MYGITETTVHVTYRRISAPDVSADAGSPIGVPLPDLAISLRDDDGSLTPDGAVGEMWVSGPGLARGYFGDPETTARAFGTVSWGPGDDRRTYRTGDLARVGADGQLFYMGRRDDQVKVRGFRIELGEIGAALKAHPGIADACVMTDTGESVGSGLLAWVTVRAGREADTDAADLRAFVAGRLPGHMVPNRLWIVDQMPLTPNGKTDRRALFDGHRASAVHAEADAPAAQDALVRTVAGIWAQELGVSTVGVEDDFFALGGHSLMVAKVIRRTRLDVGTHVPARALFEAPRLADFVERVRAATAERTHDTDGR